MGQDFRTIRDNQVYGVRATALIVRDDQIYLCYDQNEKFFTIGGAIALGESTAEAVQREVLEELGISVTVNQLAFIVENQFCQEDVNYHNIEFHYLVTPVAEPQSVILDSSAKRSCCWVSFSELEQVNLVPEFLKTELINWDGQIKHIIIKDKEK